MTVRACVRFSAQMVCARTLYKAKLKSWARVAILTKSRNATSGARVLGISLSPVFDRDRIYCFARPRRGGLRAGRPLFPYTFQERRCVLFPWRKGKNLGGSLTSGSLTRQSQHPLYSCDAASPYPSLTRFGGQIGALTLWNWALRVIAEPFVAGTGGKSDAIVQNEVMGIMGVTSISVI